jgi:hypothetical protein
MWEYWDFEFRRLVLMPGWEADEWNYDKYIVENERKMTHDGDAFASVLKEWVPNTELFKHASESECPV